MPKVLVTESSLADIADAIRYKTGESDTYRPGDMAAAIRAIPTGITPTGTVQITQNGTHDVTQYASANVNVPNSYAAGDEGKVVSNGALVAQTSRSVTANGTYDTTTNNEVVVSVTPNLQSKTATQNGTVTPDTGYDGLSSVVVNVAAGSGIEAMEPLERMHTASYIRSGTWYGSADNGDNVIEIYSVDPTHKYLYVLGETVQIANLCYSYFDPRTVTSGTRNLRNITGVSNPSKRMATNVEPPTDFIYFVAQIANTAQYSNIRGYLYDITDLTGTVS